MAYKIKGRTIDIIDSFVDSSIAPSIKLDKYTVGADKTPLSFYKKTEPWQETLLTNINIKDYYYQDGVDYGAITYRKSLGSFKDSILTNYNDYDIYIKYTTDKKFIATTIDWDSTPSGYIKASFDADRIIILLQAAGGGGGGTSVIYAGGACIGYADGGAGGSGGFCALVLNTKYLKDNGGYYAIHLGSAGSGAWGKADNAAWADVVGGILGNGAVSAESGGSATGASIEYIAPSTVAYRLFDIGGGEGGAAASGYSNGASGAGGKVAEKNPNYEGTYYWKLPIYSGNTLVAKGMLDGKSGGSNSTNGESTPMYTIRANSNVAFRSSSVWSYKIGGYSGGSSQGNTCAGGAASWLGNGGDGGSLGYGGDGKKGSTGAGGAGGRGAYGAPLVIFAGAAYIEEALQGGGGGGNPWLSIYY